MAAAKATMEGVLVMCLTLYLMDSRLHSSRAGWIAPSPFTDEDTETQRGQVTCLRSHSQYVAWLNLTLLCLTQEAPPPPSPVHTACLQPWDTFLSWGLLGRCHICSNSSSRAGAVPSILKPLAWLREACGLPSKGGLWAEGL